MKVTITAMLSSNSNIMDLAPLLLASRIPELIRASLIPDVFRDLLP